MAVSYAKFKKEIYRELARSYQPSEKVEGKEPEENGFLLQGLDEGQSILDVGCGRGDLLLAASERVGETGICWGIDISWEMLAIARSKAEKKRNVHFKQGDVTLGLSFADNSFDLVVSMDLLQEIPSVIFLVEEIYRVTKPAGYFRLIIPCLADDRQANKALAFLGRKYYWYFHTQEELRRILTYNEILGQILRMDFQVNQSKEWTENQKLLRGFDQVIQEFLDLGYHSGEISQGILLVEGKKNFG